MLRYDCHFHDRHSKTSRVEEVWAHDDEHAVERAREMLKPDELGGDVWQGLRHVGRLRRG